MKTIKADNKNLMRVIVELLNEGEAVEFKVTGNSMLPFFKNEKTVVRLKQFKDYHKHEVVLFAYEGNYILHRILKIKDDKYFIRGDGSFRIEVVLRSQIYGKVIDFHIYEKRSKGYKFKYKCWLLLGPFRRIFLKFINK